MWKKNLLLAISLLAYSSSAYAAVVVPSNPTFWINLIVSAGLLLISGYTRGVKDDQKDLTAKFHSMQLMVAQNYHSKAEIERLLQDVREWMKTIDQRLDDMEN